MVCGTLASSVEKETKIRLLSGWIHAMGPSAVDWMNTEDDALRYLMIGL